MRFSSHVNDSFENLIYLVEKWFNVGGLNKYIHNFGFVAAL